jgi:hypothetical protein
MRESEEAVLVVLGFAILAIIIMVIGVCGDAQVQPRCEIERYNCKKALRTGWDHGPTLRLDEHCDERCKEPPR